jgi:hypothetical protein
MENAHKELERHYLFYQSIFNEFLPDLVKFVDKDREVQLRNLNLG